MWTCYIERSTHSELGGKDEDSEALHFVPDYSRASKYKGSIYDMSMFFQYPNYTYRIPNVSPGLIIFRGAYIRKDIWVSLQGACSRATLYLVGFIWDFTVYPMDTLMRLSSMDSPMDILMRFSSMDSPDSRIASMTWDRMIWSDTQSFPCKRVLSDS